MVPWASLHYVIEAVLDHTHALFKYPGRLVLREELLLKRDPAMKNIGHNSEVR